MKLLKLGIESSAGDAVAVPEILGEATLGVAPVGQLLQFNHETPAGTDGLLFLVSGTATGGRSIVATTHAGVAMTQVLQDGFGSAGQFIFTGLFFRAGPPIGIFQVQSLWDGLIQNQYVAMLNLSGVDQADPIHLSDTIADTVAGLSLDFDVTRPSRLIGLHSRLNAVTSHSFNPGTELVDQRATDAGGVLSQTGTLLTREAGFVGPTDIGSTAVLAGNGGVLSAVAIAAADA